MAKYRVERVQQQIMREVTDILMHDVKDPGVKDVTITDVHLTGDLQEATVYYSTLSDDKDTQQTVASALDKVKGLVRSKVGERIHIYKTPEINFERDNSIAYGQRIDELLNQIHEENNSEQ
ncbi:MAG: 30S ribosome-binding factor RbfA [Aerococcus sp.]|nr:30S ribosome-binding factor RbfA [Aerococcus sp.]